jgi:hypothetical protein
MFRFVNESIEDENENSNKRVDFFTATLLNQFNKNNSPVENIVNLFSYESPKSQELSVDAMKYGLEEITFTRIFRIEQIQ